MRRLLSWRYLAAIAVPVALLVIAGWLTFRQLERDAARRIGRTSQVLSEHARRTLRTHEMIVDTVDRHIAGWSWDRILESRELNDLLVRSLRAGPDVASVFVMHPDGAHFNSSRRFPVPAIDSADRDYFRALREQDVLYVSAPAISRLGQDRFFALSRRRSSREGRFDGVIAVSVSSGYFEAFYSTMVESPEDAVSLIRSDGVLLARYPPEYPPGSDSSRGPGSLPPPGGTARVRSRVGGRERLVAVWPVGDYGVDAVVELSSATLWSAWSQGMIPYLLGTLLATAALLGVTRHREIAQRARVRDEEEARLLRWIDEIPALVSYLDRDLRYRFNNRAYEAWFGRSRAAMRGRPVREVMGNVAYETIRPHLETALAGQAVTYEALVPYDTGHRHVEATYVPDVVDGDVRGLFVLVMDITARRTAEEALRTSEARLTAFLTQLPLAVGMCDTQGRWVIRNAMLDRFVRGDLPSRDPVEAQRWRAWSADGRPVEPARWPGSRALRGEIVNPGMDCVHVLEDGRETWVRVSAAPFHSESGEIVGAIVVMQDIDSEKRSDIALQHSEARYRMLVSVVTDVAWTADADGGFSIPQLAWAGFTGQAWDAHRGLGWLDAIHPEDRATIRALWEQARAERAVYHAHHRLWHAATQAYRHIVARAAPVLDPDATVREWVGSCTDVHEARVAEDVRRDADRRKDEFLATLAHELRNPMAPIMNGLEIMKRADGNVRILTEAAATIERQMVQLVRLVEDLLDVSRITRGRLRLRRTTVELGPLVREVVDAFRPAAARSSHELHIEVPPDPIRVDADPARLTQVLGNLLDNAVKYTPPGGRIGLSVSRRGEDVVMSVWDTGIGIPPNMLPRVFDMFTHVDRSPAGGPSGLGIGLTLVKRLVEMHGGTVTATTDGPGRGSQFVVTLPVLGQPAAVVDPPAQAGVASLDGTGRRRVLVVDDNLDSAQTMAMLLRLAGYDTHMAHDGAEAIAAADAERPDAVLLDIGLPNLNGHDAGRMIREKPWGKNMVLVALTGWGQEADRRKSREAGFDGHLTKPVTLPDLLKVLGTLLAVRQRI